MRPEWVTHVYQFSFGKFHTSYYGKFWTMALSSLFIVSGTVLHVSQLALQDFRWKFSRMTLAINVITFRERSSNGATCDTHLTLSSAYAWRFRPPAIICFLQPMPRAAAAKLYKTKTTSGLANCSVATSAELFRSHWRAHFWWVRVSWMGERWC